MNVINLEDARRRDGLCRRMAVQQEVAQQVARMDCPPDAVLVYSWLQHVGQNRAYYEANPEAERADLIVACAFAQARLEELKHEEAR